MARGDARIYGVDKGLLNRSRAEELGRRAFSGDRDAVNELVEHNYALVRWMVRKYTIPDGMEARDLVQYGMLGLLKAAERWNPDHVPACSFSNYARFWIRQVINVSICNEGRMIRAPRDAYGLLHARSSGKELTEDQEEEIRHFERTRARSDSGESNSCPVTAYYKGRESPDHDLRLAELMECLPDRLREILEMRVFEQKSLSKVSDVVGVSKERVRQLQLLAIRQLRKHAGAQ